MAHLSSCQSAGAASSTVMEGMEEYRMAWRGLKVTAGTSLLRGDGLSLSCVSLCHGNSTVPGNKYNRTNHPRFIVKDKANVLNLALSVCRSHSCK